MNKFLHIAFNFYNRPVKTTELEPVFNKAFNWARYASNCWIVNTDLTPQAWYNLLKPHLHADDSVLICEINLNNRYGYLPQNIVDWINQNSP